MSPASVTVIFGCQVFISVNAPSVQNSVSRTVPPSQGPEAHGTSRSVGCGAVPSASAVKTTASVANITSVTGSARLAANSLRSSRKICSMKNTELNRVSASPRPSRAVRKSNRPSTATPASTSAPHTRTTAGGQRRDRSASQSGIMIA